MSKTTSNRNRRYIPDPLGRLGQGHGVDAKPRDPFGRMFEPEPETSFDLAQPFSLSKPIGEGGNNGRADVAKIETLLGLAGVMDLKPTDGPTGFAGQRLLDAIRMFQKQNNLVTDGRLNPGGPTIKALSQSLQSLGRGGDTVLAHLSPAEAGVLHAITDGGSINPKTGLLEFWVGSGTQGGRDRPEANSHDPQSSGKGSTGNNDRDAMSGNNYAERLKATSNAREARNAGGRSASSGDGANTVGERLKAMHNAREARMAAAPDRNDLEPFGGPGPEIRTRALQQQEEEKAARKPRFNRTYRSLLEDEKKTPQQKTTTQLAEQKQTSPSISQQTANIGKLREIKAQREFEEARQAKARREANYGKPTANPYTGDIAAMIAKMNKLKSLRAETPPSANKSFLDMIFESVDDFMTDPDQGPRETPPLGPPPSGPPPVPTKKNNQQTKMTAAMLAALVALFALGQLTNKNSGGSMK